MGKTSMKDLPHDLVGMNILTRIPFTFLSAVRSTCKSWNALSKDWILGKAEARQQFLGFMMMNFKVWSVSFDVRNKAKAVDDVSIKPVDLFDQLQVLKILYCDGLLLCVLKDLSRLVVWNPYLGQRLSVAPRISFHRRDRYALGYDINRNHKILRFMNVRIKGKPRLFGFEIYDFSSGSWRILKPTHLMNIERPGQSVSLKGVSYFYSQYRAYGSSMLLEGMPVKPIKKKKYRDFLLCFDFTTERFCPPMRLPFRSNLGDDIVSLSSVRQEQLTVLRHHSYTMEIWVTTKIEPNFVSWNKFLKLDMRQFTSHSCFSRVYDGSFFIDEEEKVVVTFDIDRYVRGTPSYNTAFILGENGFAKSTRLGEALNVEKPVNIDRIFRTPLVLSSPYFPSFCTPVVCSSPYFPSLMQVSQPEPETEPAKKKRKLRDDSFV